MIKEEIREELLRRRDEGYRDFQSALIPTVSKDAFIGVRTPDLRSIAKELSKREDVFDFLGVLPHKYFDENQLHAFIISDLKDFSSCVKEVESFLPFVDNWATCDQMGPKVFAKHKIELLPYVKKWLASADVYAVRFGVKMLMDHFLDEAFDSIYLEWVAALRSEEYYINMMAAWYFATALAKQEQSALAYFTKKRLSPVVLKKAVQKALESFRVSENTKATLRTLRESL